MIVYPSSAEEKIGFDVIRARLRTGTRSTLGEERVDRMEPFRHLGALRDELARVAELQEALRFDDPVPLDHILDLRDVLRRAAPEGASVTPDDLVALRYALRTLRRLRSYIKTRRERYPALWAAAEPITPLPDLEERIAEIVDDEGRVLDGASPELRRLRRQIAQQRGRLRETLMRSLRSAIAEGYATEEQPTIRGGRMVIPVRAEAKRKVDGFVQDVSATGQTVYIEPAAVLDLNNEVRELEAEERREVERILRAVTDRLREHLDAMKTNSRVLALVDFLQAKARLANDLDAVVPQLNDAGRLDIRDGRNPVLVLRFRELRADEGTDRTVVPLDLTLGADFRTLVVTGPNAGGKTVALKTVGVLALMLAYGLPVPVDEKSDLALFRHLIVDIGDEQSIEEDLSTFSSHVENLKYMLQHADDQSLVLIDEAGTGTDPAEGGALAQAVLDELTERGARTMATTHHGSLKVFAYEHDAVENGSMQFDQETLSPTYRFQPGVPGSSYAFDIAQRIGLPAATLAQARELLGTQRVTMEALITDLEQRTQQLEAELKQARTEKEEAETRRADYEAKQAKLEKEQAEIRERALAEAEGIVRGANARIERTIREIKEAEAAREATKQAREKLDRYKEGVGEQRKGVERRRRKQEARLRRAKGSQPAPSAPRPAAEPKVVPGRLTVGDQVTIDDGAMKGEVAEMEDGEAVVTVGSMKMRVDVERLTKVGGKRKQQVRVSAVQAAGGGLPSMQARQRIDLRGERVDEALQEVTRFVDEGLAAGLERLEILHGKGTGALRQAIHEYLATRRDVAGYEEAPWDEGGAGVTYVQL